MTTDADPEPEAIKTRLLEAMRLQAGHAATRAMNALGENWANTPVSGQEKAAAVMTGFMRTLFDIAVLHKYQGERKPAEWAQDPELAMECAQTVVEKIKEELRIVDPYAEYVVSVIRVSGGA